MNDLNVRSFINKKKFVKYRYKNEVGGGYVFC